LHEWLQRNFQWKKSLQPKLFVYLFIFKSFTYCFASTVLRALPELLASQGNTCQSCDVTSFDASDAAKHAEASSKIKMDELELEKGRLEVELHK
jgi:hypothetical protein